MLSTVPLSAAVETAKVVRHPGKSVRVQWHHLKKEICGKEWLFLAETFFTTISAKLIAQSTFMLPLDKVKYFQKK